MSAAMPITPLATTAAPITPEAELRQLRELLGDIRDHLGRSPDSALMPGSVLHAAVLAATDNTRSVSERS